jgi:hypothetical protein
VDASNLERSLLLEAVMDDPPLLGRPKTVVSEPVEVRTSDGLDEGSDSSASDMGKDCISSGSDGQLKRLRRKLWVTK